MTQRVSQEGGAGSKGKQVENQKPASSHSKTPIRHHSHYLKYTYIYIFFKPESSPV